MSTAQSHASAQAGGGSRERVTTMEQALTSTRPTLFLNEVADLLGVDYRSVHRGVDAGTIPSIRLGRRVLIPRKPLLALLGEDVTATEESAA